MHEYDGPPITDVYGPTPEEIRTWAYSGAMWPDQDWDIFMAEPENLDVLIGVVGDTDCPSRDSLLKSLYCLVGHTSHDDERLRRAVGVAEGVSEPWLSTWAARTRQVLDNPASFTRSDWCGLETFANSPVY